jgi:hypothetical protein
MAALRRKKVLRTAKGGEVKPDASKKLSNSTIGIAFRRLRKALATTKTHKLIGENPAADVDQPSTEIEREPVILEPDQVLRFLAA